MWQTPRPTNQPPTQSTLLPSDNPLPPINPHGAAELILEIRQPTAENETTIILKHILESHPGTNPSPKYNNRPPKTKINKQKTLRTTPRHRQPTPRRQGVNRRLDSRPLRHRPRHQNSETRVGVGRVTPIIVVAAAAAGPATVIAGVAPDVPGRATSSPEDTRM